MIVKLSLGLWILGVNFKALESKIREISLKLRVKWPRVLEPGSRLLELNL